jgi:hypothetical protein
LSRLLEDAPHRRRQTAGGNPHIMPPSISRTRLKRAPTTSMSASEVIMTAVLVKACAALRRHPS